MEDCVDELLNSLSSYNKTEEDGEEKTAGEGEENGTSEPNSGGGGGGGRLIEQIISHLPVAISGVSSTLAAAESSNEDKGGDRPEAKRAGEPGGIVPSPRIALPVDHNGPDSEF